MEKKLKSLFEYQRFARNERLSALIAESEAACSEELDDDMLFFVSAAGELPVPDEEEKP